MARPTRPVAARAAALVAVLATACASATTIDLAALTASVPAAVSPDAPSDVADVSCPTEFERGFDIETVCTATLGGQPIVVRARQTDGDGSIEISVDEQLIDVATIEAQAQDRFVADLMLDAVVSCEGSRRRVLGAGFVATCAAQDDAGPRPFTITVAADGTFTVALE